MKMRLGLSLFCLAFVASCTLAPVSRPPVLDASWRASEKDIVVSSGIGISESSKDVTSDVNEQNKVTPVEAVPKLRSIDQPKEQVDMPVAALSLLKEADQLRGAGDFVGASARLERAQRIVPNEPESYFQLSSLRLDQGSLKAAVNIATQGLVLAGEDRAMKRDLYILIARARDALGDTNGATKARHLARAAGS